MEQIPIPIGRKVIRLRPGLFAETVIRYLRGKDGGTALELTVRFGSAVNGTRLRESMGCSNRHVDEETLVKAFLMAWNALVEKREDFMEQWKEQMQSENLLESYRTGIFMEYTNGAEPLTEMDTDFMLKTLDHIKVYESGVVVTAFLDGTEIELGQE